MGKKILAVFLGLLVVVSFIGFLATNTVKANLVSSDYYKGLLSKNNIWDRLYDDLPNDPAFAPQIEELLGHVSVQKEDLVPTLKKIAPPEVLKGLFDFTIDNLIGFIQGTQKLQLTIDIKPIVDKIHETVLPYAKEHFDKIPIKEVASMEEFDADLEQVLTLIQGKMAKPTGIPKFAIPDDQKADVINRIVVGTGLDASNEKDADFISKITEAVNAGDVDAAIKIALDPALDKLVDKQIEIIKHSKYVTELEAATGVQLMLGPPPEVTSTIEDKLALVNKIHSAISWARPLSLVAILLLSGLIALLFWKKWPTVMRWTGAPLLIAGTIGFVGWMIGRGIARGKLADIVATKGAGLPASLQAMMGDVLRSSADDLTMAIWGPSIALMVIGIGLIVGATIVNRRAAKGTPMTAAPASGAA